MFTKNRPQDDSYGRYTGQLSKGLYSVTVFKSIFFLKFQNISGFAIKHLTDRCKGGKANSRYFVVFDFRIYSISRIEIALVCGIVFHSTFANNAIINEIFPIISKIGNVNEYHNFLYHFIFAILLFSIINM